MYKAWRSTLTIRNAMAILFSMASAYVQVDGSAPRRTAEKMRRMSVAESQSRAAVADLLALAAQKITIEQMERLR